MLFSNEKGRGGLKPSKPNPSQVLKQERETETLERSCGWPQKAKSTDCMLAHFPTQKKNPLAECRDRAHFDPRPSLLLPPFCCVFSCLLHQRKEERKNLLLGDGVRRRRRRRSSGRSAEAVLFLLILPFPPFPGKRKEEKSTSVGGLTCWHDEGTSLHSNGAANSEKGEKKKILICSFSLFRMKDWGDRGGGGGSAFSRHFDRGKGP